MKILLISGHGNGDSGALGKFQEASYKESELTIDAVKTLKALLDKYQCEVDVYPYERNAYKDWKNKVLDQNVNFKNYDYVLEVHYNASVADVAGDGKIKGSEIWVSDKEKTTGVEEKILANLKEIGFTNRGIKKTNNLAVICHVKNMGVSSALVEICFIDDYDDMNLYVEKSALVYDAVAKGIIDGFGIKKKEEPIQVGQRVKIKSGAVYGGLGSARGKAVSKYALNGTWGVLMIQEHKGVEEALLGGINSWVAVASLTGVE